MLHPAIDLSLFYQYPVKCLKSTFIFLSLNISMSSIHFQLYNGASRKGKSTLTALLSSTHDWLTELDRNKDVCCVFFDFQKAFDTVPHRNLIKRLEDLNLHPLLLKWTSSYLMNHNHHVVVNGSVLSESTTVISGVLQGSVLGPLLFLIYIDSITSVPLSEGSKISLYADDMMLYKPISSSADLTNL